MSVYLEKLRLRVTPLLLKLVLSVNFSSEVNFAVEFSLVKQNCTV